MSQNTNESRRDFLKQAAVASSFLMSYDPLSTAAGNMSAANVNTVKDPWYRTVTRWGQVNITEIDAEKYDISWWRGFWKRTETKGIVVNAGGIVAYYPTKIPLHYQPPYLNGSDLFGSIVKAAHEDGIAVFARMDSNKAHEEFYKAHPDWFAIDATGKPYRSGEFYLSCVNSPYYDQHIPAILKEIAENYHPEGFTDNSWSGIGRDMICYCENCKKSFYEKAGSSIPSSKNWDDPVYRKWITWNYARRMEIWDLNNKTTKAAGGENCIWVGMNSGSIHAQGNFFRDYAAIASRAEMIMLDDQSRNDQSGFQRNGEIGKLLHGLIGWDKLIPESMAMYQGGGGSVFRLAAKAIPEARMWMINGIAGGIQPWWHQVGAYHEDRRMYATAEPVMKWHRANEQYLLNREPVASIAVVWSQQHTDFYGRDNANELVELPWRGFTQSLVRARIPYLPVNADHITRDSNKFKLLILPNLAAMSDEQVSAVKAFADNGGSVIATGETSLYNEWGDKRKDFALAELFGAHYIPANEKIPGEKLAGNSYHTYLRLTPELRSQLEGPKNGKEPPIKGQRHEILKGFEETDILPFGGLLQQLKLESGTEVPLTYVPQFPGFPPELSWMREPVTDIPGIVLHTTNKGGRVAFVPADIDRQFARNNFPDHGNLLRNIVNWAAKDSIPLRIEGKGLIDCHLYHQAGRLILHVVNLTSSATWRQPIDDQMAIGPFRVSVKATRDVRGKSVQLMVGGRKVAANVANGWIQFEIGSILDHEMAVIA